MMEGMDQNIEEEYILAMRLNSKWDDSEGWKERKLHPLTTEHSSNLLRRNATYKNLVPMTDSHTSRILASLVPDEIIYNVNDYRHRSYNICLLFGDVSGFTELNELYNKTGKGGPSRLTHTLNNYLGSMVQEILSHNGDILKFSGDAFLAMWKCTTNYFMHDIVHAAIDSAIMIQKTLGTYETEVGVTLRVKLAVSAGFAMFSLIGDSKMSHYIVVGQPVSDVKYAESHASPGEIVVSNSAWHYLNSNEFVWETIDAYLTKIKNITPIWRPVTQTNKVDKAGFPDSDSLSPTSSKEGEDEIDAENLLTDDARIDDFSLRPSVNYAAKMNLKEDLRKFIIPPIMRGIDLDQPLEYLTEMRQIVIVFMNIVIEQKMDLSVQLDLIDLVYQRTCEVVNDMQGCVNKASMFDKDLMFVLLFGLRGYKNELESQMGLRCATECHQAISKLNVMSTSIAVTTGMTYCGVIGHTLRKEYTVISSTVNKAARLMMTYVGKVVCDRETFLHSKLDARNFILQEAKALKGIKNVGPIYEFKEQQWSQGNITINPFPLLGQEEHLKLYHQLLHKSVQRFSANKTNLIYDESFHIILIQGDPRIGKTRLLDEFMYLTPSSTPVNRFTLSKKDEKIPYQTIQRIASMPLGLRELSTMDERKTKLESRLNKLKSPEWLCSLNQVFSVNYKKSKLYTELSNHNKDYVLQIVMKQLFSAGFTVLWVVAIDNAEFIDDKSWTFINLLLDMELIFLIMTVTTDGDTTQQILNTLDNKKVNIINLQPLDKWYQAGLACQILNVRAISPELERLIQTKSNGNPGWIESFLVTLIQSEGVKIQHMTRTEIIDVGLVTPPLQMLTRLPNEVKEDTKEESTESLIIQNVVIPKFDSWNMYKWTYRDSIVNLLKDKIEEQYTDYSTPQPVCVILPFCKLDEDTEFSMDALIIKLFDSLTSYEQLLLKCSSVLGEYFQRKMLLFIMMGATPRATALAIKKLFELRVLSCAKGDFTRDDTSLIFSQQFTNPNQDSCIECYCKSLHIHETCVDLPKYASCGYLRFQQITFRNTTYNLLTDNQKKNFHSRAIRYLEKETRRCRSCGNGYFAKLFGTRYDEGFMRRRKTQSKYNRKDSQTSIDSKKSIPSKQGIISVFLNKNESSELLHSRNWSELGKDHNVQRRTSLIKTFSYADFRLCQCPIILNTMYTKMLEHCQGAGKLNKLVCAMLEYAYISIVLSNVTQALRILTEAQTIVNQGELCNEDTEITWQIPLIKGKIETLTGHALLELGQLEDAYMCFTKALNFYGYRFPVSSVQINLEIFVKELKQRLNMYVCPTVFIGTAEGYEAEFLDDVAECLSLLYKVFIDFKMWKHAELSATWSLTKSLASDSDFFGLCTSYKNMLEICNRLGKTCLTRALEVNGLLLCHRKFSSIESHELQAVSELYGTIFCSRLMKSELEHAVHIGYIITEITSTIHAIQISLNWIPMLVYVLLLLKRNLDAVSAILQLDYYSHEDLDNTAKAWYYSSCIVLQLESGYLLTSYEDCEKFYQIEGDNLLNIGNSEAVKRFYVVMWLWCLRTEEWDSVHTWYKKLYKLKPPQSDDSLNNLITYLYLLEGLLLYTVAKINKKNYQAITDSKSQVTSLFRVLNKASKNNKIISPRLQHLKAYYNFIEHKDANSVVELEKAKEISSKYNNTLEYEWAEHSAKVWNNDLSPIILNFWREHSRGNNAIDYHEIYVNDDETSCYYYSLPIPKYY